MLPLSPDALRQRLRSFASRAQPVRILLTLGSLMAGCAWTGHTDAVIPLFLGAIASARGAPELTFLFLSIFLAFCGVWSHHAIRFRQLSRAPIDPVEPDNDASQPP